MTPHSRKQRTSHAPRPAGFCPDSGTSSANRRLVFAMTQQVRAAQTACDAALRFHLRQAQSPGR
jgi:hypothetical protein